VLPDAVTLKDAPTHTDEDAVGVAELLGAVGFDAVVNEPLLPKLVQPLLHELLPFNALTLK
jgi:hypothetical protein